MATMKLLLDTHALLWWLFDAPELSSTARSPLADTSNRAFVSAASAWEIATLVRLGRLEAARPLMDGYDGWIARAGFSELPVLAQHAILAGSIDSPHRDPFDRMLAAQARLEDLILLNRDLAMDGLGARRIW
jgi:PIN domain nuclease of toxin-antitoxin system